MTILERGSGIKCIAIHGFAEGAFVWEPLLDSANHEFCVVAPDLRGHGDSEWDPEARYAVADYTRDIECLIDTIGGGPLILIGHSLGGRIALELAASGSFDVRGLILVDFSFIYSPELSARVADEFHANQRDYASPGQFATLLKTRRPLLSELAAQRAAVRTLRRCDDGWFRLKADPAIRLDREKTQHSVAMLSRVPCPALVIRGAWSAVLSAQVAAETAALLPDATVTSVERAGHAVMSDNPSGFIQAALPAITRYADGGGIVQKRP